MIECERKCRRNYGTENQTDGTQKCQKRATENNTARQYQRSKCDKEYASQLSQYSRPLYNLFDDRPISMFEYRLVPTENHGLQLARSKYARSERYQENRMDTNTGFRNAKTQSALIMSHETRWRDFRLSKNERLAHSIQLEIENQLAYEETEAAVLLDKAKADLKLKAAKRRLNLSNRGIELARERSGLNEKRQLYELESIQSIRDINKPHPDTGTVLIKEKDSPEGGTPPQPDTKATANQRRLIEGGTSYCNEYDNRSLILNALRAPRDIGGSDIPPALPPEYCGGDTRKYGKNCRGTDSAFDGVASVRSALHGTKDKDETDLSGQVGTVTRGQWVHGVARQADCTSKITTLAAGRTPSQELST
jgi:hypothetical protein